MVIELQDGCVALERIPTHFGQRNITKLSNLSTKNELKKVRIDLLHAKNIRSYSEVKISKETNVNKIFKIAVEEKI